MTKIIKRILMIAGVGIILYLGISFFAVFWLTYFSSPKRIESLPQEKKMFTRLKKEYHLKKIERAPETEHRLLTPKDTLTYSLYLTGVDCTRNEEEMKRETLEISKEVNKLGLHQNFYKYEIVFYCQKFPPGVLRYQFLRKSLH